MQRFVQLSVVGWRSTPVVDSCAEKGSRLALALNLRFFHYSSLREQVKAQCQPARGPLHTLDNILGHATGAVAQHRASMGAADETQQGAAWTKLDLHKVGCQWAAKLFLCKGDANVGALSGCPEHCASWHCGALQKLVQLADLVSSLGVQLKDCEQRKAALIERKLATQARLANALGARVDAASGALDKHR